MQLTEFLYEEWVSPICWFLRWTPKVPGYFFYIWKILRRKSLPLFCYCLDAVYANYFCIKFNVHIECYGFNLFCPCYRGQRLGSVRSRPRPVSSSSPSCPRSSPSCTATSLTPIPGSSRPWAPSGTPWSKTTRTRWGDKKIHMEALPDNFIIQSYTCKILLDYVFRLQSHKHWNLS